MTIHRLIQNSPLNPEDIERLVVAYEHTLRELGLTDRNDPLTLVVAKKVIEIRQTGIRDPAQISELALKQLKLP
jgi:hypothetical protein